MMVLDSFPDLVGTYPEVQANVSSSLVDVVPIYREVNAQAIIQ